MPKHSNQINTESPSCPWESSSDKGQASLLIESLFYLAAGLTKKLDSSISNPVDEISHPKESEAS